MLDQYTSTSESMAVIIHMQLLNSTPLRLILTLHGNPFAIELIVGIYNKAGGIGVPICPLATVHAEVGKTFSVSA